MSDLKSIIRSISNIVGIFIAIGILFALYVFLDPDITMTPKGIMIFIGVVALLSVTTWMDRIGDRITALEERMTDIESKKYNPNRYD
jgi:hypothetical protein